jgi:hypothetical protein
MALDRSKLSGRLRTLFTSPDGIANAQDAESRWTAAYDSYALDAEDVSGDMVTTTNRPGFLSALDFGSWSSVQQAAQRFDDAFVAYWTGGVFAVGSLIAVPPGECPNVGGNGTWASETTSVVTAVVAGVLKGLLLPILRANSGTPESKAREMARAFHEATTTAVTVLITGLDTTPGPGGPLAITNTCTIR